MTPDNLLPDKRGVCAAVAQPDQEDPLERMFASFADALFVFDSAGLVTRMNDAACRLLGLESGDDAFAALPMCGRIERLNPRASDGAPLPEGERVLDRLLRGEVITNDCMADVLITRADGSDALAAFTGAPIRDGQGAIVGAIVTGRDMTERLQVEAKLRESNERLRAENETLTEQVNDLKTMNRRMDQFLGMANHEMKSPLTSLSANLQLALRRLRRLGQSAEPTAAEPAHDERALREVEPVVTLLVRVQNAARRMTRLVDELLDVSRIQTGRLEAHPEPCDLLALTHAVIDERRQAHPERIIQVESSSGRIDAMADADRITEVIDNFLSNAIKYSPDDTVITVRVAPGDDGSVRVSVRDEGQGIAPERQPRVWNVFERLDAASSQRANDVNLGLGLHICKSIITLHGGEVGVESAEGAGSTFWFTLPMAPQPNS